MYPVFRPARWENSEVSEIARSIAASCHSGPRPLIATRADPGERRYNRAGMHAAGTADGAQTATRQELSADAIL